MSDVKELATITLIRRQDNHIDVFVTSHPDKCDLEQLAGHVLRTMQAMISAAKKDTTPPSEKQP